MWISRSAAVLLMAYIAVAVATPALPSNGHSFAKVKMQARQTQVASTEAEAFAKIRAEWAKRLHEKQLDPLVDMYTPDGVFLIPSGERFAGRDAIRELCRNTMAIMTSDITMRSIVTESSGSLAYDSGQFEETLIRVSDGKRFESRGSYLMVLKKQSDGRWLIAQQVWTGVEPPGLGQPG